MKGFRRDEHTSRVETRKGPVRGYLYDGIHIFKGIPYARARRFHAPEETENWKGELDACSYGYVCPLLTNDPPRGELWVPHRFWLMDEDCLNLNVWTPGLDGERRPVLVWFHGGGFEAGSAIEHIAYDGEAMSRCGNAVVVTVNHRLNILGYLDLSDFGEEYANSGNTGTDDLIAALRWVRDNIAAFGGDPDNVTLFGQSGGGGKVTTLLQTPAADGLYHRGVVMSGVIGPVLADAEGSGRRLAERLLEELRLPDIRSLETVEYAAMARAYRAIRPELQKEGAYAGCRPHPNAFYLGDPCVRGFRKETADIPLLVGSVFGEFVSFLPLPRDQQHLSEPEQTQAVRSALGAESADLLLPLFRSAYPSRQPLDLLRLDIVMRCPEIDYLRRRSALNRHTYAYLFNMDQPMEGMCPPWHCCDIPYWFHNIRLVEYPHGPMPEGVSPDAMQDRLFASLMAFARTGCPETDMPWPACTPEKEYTMIFDAESRVGENFDHDLMALAPGHLSSWFLHLREAAGARVQH